MSISAIIKGVALQKLAQLIFQEAKSRPRSYRFLEDIADIVADIESRDSISEMALDEITSNLSPGKRSIIRSALRELRQMSEENQSLEVFPEIESVYSSIEPTEIDYEEDDEYDEQDDETEDSGEVVIPESLCQFPLPLKESPKVLADQLIRQLRESVDSIFPELNKYMKEQYEKFKDYDIVEGDDDPEATRKSVEKLLQEFAGPSMLLGGFWMVNLCLELCEERIWSAKRLLISARSEIVKHPSISQLCDFREKVLCTDDFHSLLGRGVSESDVMLLKSELDSHGTLPGARKAIRDKYADELFHKRLFSHIMKLMESILGLPDQKNVEEEEEKKDYDPSHLKALFDLILYYSAFSSFFVAIAYYDTIYDKIIKDEI